MQPTQRFPVLTSQSISRERLFEIQSLAEADDELAEKYRQPHIDSYYKIIWIIGGTGTSCIDLKKFDIKDNQVVCVGPGQLHKLHLSSTVRGFIFSFTESFLNISSPSFHLTSQTNLLQLFTNANGIVIKDEMLTELLEISEKMMEEYKNAYLFKNEVLKRYLKIFLIYLARQSLESVELVMQTRATELVQNFMKLLDKHFRAKKWVAEYAAALFVTPNYLNEVIKRHTGNSAGYHIRNRIADEAKQMALYSQMSMKEVGYDLGFSDPAHFSKFFKAVTGVNFSCFKKELITHAVAL